MSYEMVVAIPCHHPAAPDSYFYCAPAYFNSENMRDQFEFMMVDTPKAIAKLRRENPRLLGHAAGKFSGTAVEGWLAPMTPSAPLSMGFWTYNPVRGLAMGSGETAMIGLVQRLELPCFPIAVSKAEPVSRRIELRDQIGYRQDHMLTVPGDLSEFLQPVSGSGGYSPDSLRHFRR